MKTLPVIENFYCQRNKYREPMKKFNKKAGILSILLVSFFIFACSNNSDNVDIQPPKVLAISPADASTDAPINAEISVQFNKSVTGISSSNFYLNKLGIYGNLPCTVSYNDSTKTATMILSNDATFNPDTVYVVTLENGILSRTGVAMKPYSWSFTTGKTVDNVSPTIASATPGYDELRVPVGQDISIVFSEQIQSTTVTDENVVLTTVPGDSTASVSCVITYNDVAKKVVIDPDNNLSDNTKYYIILSQNIKDIAGNPLAGVTNWSFTTDDLHDPTIIKKTPDGTSTVSTNAEIIIDFSESLKNTSSDIKNTGACSLLRVTDNYPIDFNCVYDDDQHQLVIRPATVLDSNTQYKVIVTSLLKDRADNPVAYTNWTFATNAIVDNVIPKIDNSGTDGALDDSYPLEDQTGIPVDSNIDINFSESVSGLNSVNCILQRVDNNAEVNCNLVVANPKKLQIQPVGSLIQGLQYRIHLTAGIKDAAGNAMADTAWIFTTEDNTKPQITGFTPGTENGVNVNTPVIISFSESVVNVNAFTFILEDESGNPVSSSVNYIDSTKTATLTPDALSYSENYTVVLSPDSENLIRDRFGNSLNKYSWSFATGDLPDTTPPAVVSTVPGNSVEIGLNPVISVIFSENILSGTAGGLVSGLNSSNFIVKQGTTVIDGLIQYSPFSYTATFQANSTLDYGKVYTVTVLAASVEDNAGNKLAADHTFSFTTIQDTVKPYIKSKSPDSGVTVPGNAASVTVEFSENVLIPAGSFILKNSGGSAVTATVSYSNANKKAVLTPTGTLATGTYTAELTTAVVDLSGNTISPDNTNSITWSFNVIAPDEISPTVVSSSRVPAAGASNIALTTNVEFSFDENVIGVDGTSVKLKKNGTDNVSAVILYSSSSHKVIIDPEFALDYNTPYTITLSNAIHDAAGNVLTPVNWTFTTGVDNIAPQVVNGSRSPANGDINVSVNSPVSLTFDEAITNYSGSISLSPSVSGNITISSNSKTLTFTPSSAMLSEQLYTVTVSNVITDIATSPNNFAGTSWHFTTTKVPDTTNPYIILGGRVPASGAGSISQSGNITIQFNENIKNYSSSTVYLSKGTTVVPAAVSYNSTTFTVTLNPADDLIGGTVYTVTVKGGGATGILDLSDNPLTANDSWTFTTIADSTAPAILNDPARNPGIDATGVSTKTAVSATFSESVSGVSENTFTLYNGSTRVPCIVSYDSSSKTATLIPGYDLTSNTVYTVNLTASITDLSGNSLVATTWNFTTVSNLPQVDITNYDSVDPKFTTSPKNSDTGVSVTKDSLVVTFSKYMNSEKRWAEITEGTSADPAGVILDNGTWSNGDAVNGYKTITYKVTGQFKPSTVYRLKLYGWGGTFEDMAGNVLDKTVNLTTGYIQFTTGTDTTSPVIVKNFPKTDTSYTAGRSIGMLKISFSEPINVTGSESISITPAEANTALGTVTYNWTDGNRTLNFVYDNVYTTHTNDRTLIPTSVSYITGDRFNVSSSSGWNTGDLVKVSSTGTIPAPLVADTFYYAISSTGRIQLATTAARAASSNAIDLTSAGSGTITLYHYTTSITHNYSLTANTQYTVTLSGFSDYSSRALTPNTFTFTTGNATGSTSLLTEGFENYTSPNFTNFYNVSSDSSYTVSKTNDTSCDWSRLADGVYSGNGTELNGPEGSYFAKASSWEWDYDDYGNIVVSAPVNCYTQASYLLSFSMMHENVYNGADRVAVYAKAGDTNFTDSDLITDGAFNGVYRYNWSLSSDDPVWTVHYFDLSALKGNNTVYIMIRGISGGDHGSNALIDDLKVTRY